MTALLPAPYMTMTRALLVAERAGDLVHDGSFCAVVQPDSSFLVTRTGIARLLGERVTVDGEYARIWSMLATRLLAKPRSR